MSLAERFKSGIRRVARSIGWPEVVHLVRNGGGGAMIEDGPDKPYAQIEAVHRCVTTYVNAAYQLPLMISTADDQLVESGPLVDMIEKANPSQSLCDVIADFVGWLLLTGRAHLIFTEMVAGLPTQIVAAGRDQMRPVFKEGPNVRTGTVVGWLWRKPGQRWDTATPVRVDQQWPVTLRNFDPERPWDGLSITDVVQRKINQVYKADSANERSLDNDMRIGCVISPEEPIQRDQWKDFLDTIAEQNKGYMKRQTALVTNRKVNVEPQTATFSDMEFGAMLDRSTASICVGFGFDPAAVGYPPQGGRFEYVKAAKASAWIDAIIPFYGWISDEFDRGVLSLYESDRSLTWKNARASVSTRGLAPVERSAMGYRQKSRRISRAGRAKSGRLFAWFDDSGVPAMREAKLSLAKEAESLIKVFKAPPADVNDLFDIGLPTHPHQERGWQTFSEMMIGDETPEQEQDPPPPNEPTPEGDVEEIEAAMIARAAEKVVSAKQRRRLWLAWRRSWAGIERSLRSSVEQHFYRLEREMLANLRDAMPKGFDPSTPSGDPSPAKLYYTELVECGVENGGRSLYEGKLRFVDIDMTTTQRDLVARLLFNVTVANGKLVAVAGPLVREATRLGGQQSMDEAAAAADAEGVPFKMKDPAVSEILRQGTTRITDINKRAAQRMRAKLSQALKDGQTRDQMEELIKDTLGIERRRAKLIAFQEVGGAVERARQIGRDQAKVPSKSWLWSHKPEGRDWHEATENRTMAEPVANGVEFVIVQTGNRCMHPRGTGTAVDDINCACTSIARYPDDKFADARGVEHLTRHGFTTCEDIARRFDADHEPIQQPTEV